MDTSQVKPRQTAVSLDPPTILVSTQPAVLLIIDGDPALYDIEGTDLQKVVNTNWDLFYDKKGKRFYLCNGCRRADGRMETQKAPAQRFSQASGYRSICRPGKAAVSVACAPAGSQAEADSGAGKPRPRLTAAPKHH